jgi:hypothetical protein
MKGSEQPLAANYLDVTIKDFRDVKALGERAIAQISDERRLNVRLDEESNSIAIIVKHLTGNMRSRWTNFLTTDGEKPDRNRDGEFDVDTAMSRDDLLAEWDRGWQLVFDALTSLTADDLLRKVTIRGQEHTVLEAISRQLAHYNCHVGQIVFLAKHLESERWQSLSVPRGKSAEYKP